MILKYVLKNFSRRKVRTILMILSLLVSSGLIVTMSATVETVRQSNVDLIASAVGRYDLAVTKTDTSLDPFINIDEVSPIILTADPNIIAVYPRMVSTVEMNANGTIGDGTMIALDPAKDDIGFVDVVSGTYELGDGRIALLEDAAVSYGLSVGDTLIASYSFPSPREVGQEAVEGGSQRRTTESFSIAAIVRQDGIVGGAREGFIVDLQDVQNWLNLPGRSQSLIATVDPSLYESSNAEAAALEVRDVVRAVQRQLGDEYNYNLDKAAVLSQAAQGFLVLQALINTYGVMALGVVGLLVHTLVMTNVQEQRRDMAILRILGSQRNFLFTLVIAEVLTIGVIGVSLGVGLGQLITRFIVVPLIQAQMATAGITSPLVPQVSIGTLLPVITASFVVLILSSLKPAQEAARTKVMHAINPGVADNIQIEDLARLRERRPDFKLFLGGLALMLIFALIAGFQVVDTFGGPALEVMFILLALGLMVLGLGLMFFITTVPFERFVLFVMGLIMPRLTYFARRNVGRGQSRNTLISLLVLFSGVLPSFLATQVAMEDANFEATVRQNIGAQADVQSFGASATVADQERNLFNIQFRTQELTAVPGVGETVGFTYGFNAHVQDTVGFKNADFTVYGIDGFINDVFFADLIEFVAGEPDALDALLQDPQAIIISEGLATHLAVGLGDTIKVQGAGTDHVVNARIIAIARKLPSLDGIDRSRTTAEFGSDALMSIDGFRELITPLNQPLPAADRHLLQRIAITLAPDASAETVVNNISDRFRGDYPLWIRSLAVQLEENQRAQAVQRIFLLVLTTISFTTAVFGVFAVIYVTIYSRRIEIGMMKAIGMRRRELTGMLIVESITMTLGAALAGIAAGAAMGYISFYGERALSQRPADFAFDTTVVPFIVIMVTLASILGAAFSARRIVTKKAIEILRM